MAKGKKPVGHAPSGDRKHTASYASDKRNGGYMVRVVGPSASAFVGREIPVKTRAGEEHTEKLTRLVWSGLDTGTEDQPGTGLPCALYKFESKPKDMDDEIPF